MPFCNSSVTPACPRQTRRPVDTRQPPAPERPNHATRIHWELRGDRWWRRGRASLRATASPTGAGARLPGLGLRLPLEAATAALGRLDAVTELLPDPAIFVYGYVRKEAVLSSQIEGTQSSLADLMLHEAGGVPATRRSDVLEVSNAVAALDHGVERLRGGFPIIRAIAVLREHARTSCWRAFQIRHRPCYARRIPAVTELDRRIAWNGTNAALPSLHRLQPCPGTAWPNT